MEKSLITTSDEMKSTGGRKAATYIINKRTKASVGLYLTGHHIHAVAVDLAGDIISAYRVNITFNLDDDVYLKELANIVEVVRVQANVEKENLLGVAIALPGILSDDNETVLIGAAMNFTGKTKAQITKYIKYDCKLIHDSFAAIFAETWDSPQSESFFYIGLNNFIGGAVYINGQVYNGNDNHCGEVGHLKIAKEEGKKCYCGKVGCFETVCSATILSSLSDNNLDLFFDMLRNNDSVAIIAWEKYLHYLAKAITSIRLLFDCTIIVGGYVGARMGDYMDELCDLLDEDAFFDDYSRNYVRQCKYTIEDVGAGAALLYIDEFIQAI